MSISRLAPIGAAWLAALLSAGCSISIPTVGVAEEEEIVTGSIAPESRTPLSTFLEPTEEAAAMTAIGAALDPQSSGAAQSWSAHGGRKGVVHPTAAAEPVGDDICRKFEASGVGVAGAFRATGLACRNKRGEWSVREMRSRQKA